jgi:small ligand-binding sensory domain FIST
MKFASAFSTGRQAAEIVRSLRQQIVSQLSEPDLIIVFCAATLRDEFPEMIERLHLAFSNVVLLGAIAESIVTSEREFEREAAVSAIAARLPNVDLHAFHLDDEWQELIDEPDALHRAIGAASDLRGVMLIGDPFTSPIVQLLERFGNVFPEAPVFGGMVSGISAVGEALIAVGDSIHRGGIGGIAFSGDVQIDCVVSQGCRPIGQSHVITKCERNVIYELGGAPSFQTIELMVEQLSAADRQLVQQNGLQVGMVIDEGKGDYGRGDFVIRTIIDLQRESGALAVADRVTAGQTIQFHVRDAASATEDMKLLLEGELQLADMPAGAILFTCTGRGTRMFHAPSHDVTVTRAVLTDVPLAGMFCAGELGPVNGRNFIHGHTASFALFRPTEPPLPLDHEESDDAAGD